MAGKMQSLKEVWVAIGVFAALAGLNLGVYGLVNNQITNLGNRLEAKIEAEAREPREFHRQILQELREMHVRVGGLEARVAVREQHEHQ